MGHHQWAHFALSCFDVEEERWKVGLQEMERFGGNGSKQLNNWYVLHIHRTNDCLETLICTSDVGVQEFHKQPDSMDEACRRKDYSTTSISEV